MTQSDIGIVEKLTAPAYWMSGSSDGHEGENDAPREAAAIITEMVEALEEAQSELDAIKEYCDSDDTSLIWPTAERGSKAIDTILAKVSGK